MQFLYIELLFSSLEISHFDISGIDTNELHSLNILPKFVTFFVFHFDISGNDTNELHSLNILPISVT